MYNQQSIQKTLEKGNVRSENLTDILNTNSVKDETLRYHLRKLANKAKEEKTNTELLDSSIEYFKNFIEEDNNSIFSNYLYFTALFFNKEISRGIEELKSKINSTESANSKYYLLEALGYFYFHDKNFSNSKKTFEKAISTYSFNHLSYRGLSLCLSEMGEFSQASRCIKHVIDDFNKFPNLDLKTYFRLEINLIANSNEKNKLEIIKKRVDYFDEKNLLDEYQKSFSTYLEVHSDEFSIEEHYKHCEELLKKSERAISSVILMAEICEIFYKNSLNLNNFKIQLGNLRGKNNFKKNIIDMASNIVNWIENNRSYDSEKNLLNELLKCDKLYILKFSRFYFKIIEESNFLEHDEKLNYFEQHLDIISETFNDDSPPLVSYFEKIKYLRKKKLSFIALNDIEAICQSGKLSKENIDNLKCSALYVDILIDCEIIENAHEIAKKNFETKNDIDLKFKTFEQLILIHTRFGNKQHKINFIKNLQDFLDSDLCINQIDENSRKIKSAALYEQAGDFRKSQEVYMELATHSNDVSIKIPALIKCLDLSIKLRSLSMASSYFNQIDSFEEKKYYAEELASIYIRYYELLGQKEKSQEIIKKYLESISRFKDFDSLLIALDILLESQYKKEAQTFIEKIIIQHSTNLKLTSAQLYILYITFLNHEKEKVFSFMEILINCTTDKFESQRLMSILIEDAIDCEKYQLAKFHLEELKKKNDLHDNIKSNIEYFQILLKSYLDENACTTEEIDEFIKSRKRTSSKVKLRLDFIKIKYLLKNKNFKTAATHCEEMISHFKMHEFYSDKLKSSVALSLAKVRIKLEQFDLAIEELNTWTQSIYHEHDTNIELDKIFETLSEIYYRKNDIRKSRFYLEYAINLGGKNSIRIFDLDEEVVKVKSGLDVIDHSLRIEKDSEKHFSKTDESSKDKKILKTIFSHSQYRDYSQITIAEEKRSGINDYIIRTSRKFADRLISKGITEIVCHYSKTETMIFDILPGEQKHEAPSDKLTIKFSPLENVNDIQEGQLFIDKQLDGLHKESFNEIQKKIKNELKIFCTSWSSQDIYEMKIDSAPFLIPPMWSHYGSLFYGSCLILDKVKIVEEITNQNSSDFNIIGAKRVIYQYFQNQNNVTYELSKTHIDSIIRDNIYSTLLNSSNRELRDVKNLFFFKPPQWNYEKEFRIILHSKKDGPLLLNISKSAVLGLIVGRNIKSGYEKILKRICKDNDWYFAKYNPSSKNILEDLD